MGRAWSTASGPPPPASPRSTPRSPAPSSPAAAAPQDQLSDGEREVLVPVADGLANKQIARHLGITERTVKAHLTSIFQTIGVTDRTQAALWAERNRLRGGGA